MKSREVHLTAYPKGEPTPEHFKLGEADIPEPAEGEVRVVNKWLSVDPYMRGRMSGIRTYIDPFALGAPMEGGAVGQVESSNHEGFAPGDWVMSMNGWREAYVAPGQGLQKLDTTHIAPEDYLGIAGLTGMTAYVGLKRCIDLQAGESVWISAGAGAVGSAAIQFSKAMGAKVVATAGGQDKVEYCRSIGADSAVDYKSTDNLAKAVKQANEGGVDGYFENVGGTHWTAALEVLKPKGRIAACGMIQRYNDAGAQPLPDNLTNIVAKSLHIQGFIVSDHFDMLESFIGDLGAWMAAGKVTPRNTVKEGIENMPSAFMGLFSGENTGKMLVKL
ncbi:NADP-dependent oxidoreductase [Hyphobacterium sp.]|uniref:NADP-dependent oxidoreductase n=1 Tax=Hyphobacterium sp. TaxID=2004662 RepID=UPI003BAD04F8